MRERRMERKRSGRWKDRMMEREGEERDGGDGVEDRRENQEEGQ